MIDTKLVGMHHEVKRKKFDLAKLELDFARNAKAARAKTLATVTYSAEVKTLIALGYPLNLALIRCREAGLPTHTVG